MTRPPISLQDESTLLLVARQSIQHGLQFGKALEVDLEKYSPPLTDPGAAFVTLEKGGQLRGCIGSIEAHRPLIQDVAEHAWNAAFRDPRFPQLTEEEYHMLSLEISILTQPEPMSFVSEQDLMEQIQPGRDGLIIQDGYRRGLFLPAVWDKLPDVETFLRHLKQKAGLPGDYWSDTTEVQRFFSHEFGEHGESTP